MGNLIQDLRYAFRTLRKAPLFTSVAVLSLALGIGANTAIFTLVNQLILQLLPVRDPEQLVLLTARGQHYGANTGNNAISYPMYQDFRDKNQVFQGLFCRFSIPFSLTYEGRTELVQGELVSGNYFPVLGVGAALGRVFTAQDDLIQGGHPLAVLSYGYWKTRFATDPNVIGRKIVVNGYPLTVVGVSRQGFDGVEPGYAPQLRVPMMMKPQLADRYFDLNNRRRRFAQVFGRHKIPLGKAALTSGCGRGLMELEFEEYRTRKIVNVHKHVDGPWYWDKYSSHPYIGCRSGCEFCFLRGSSYLGRRDPNRFDTFIQVKVNAVESLRKEIKRLPPDVIACGDWQQPAEDRYRLSRGMLEVVLDAGFPLFVVERSPLLTRDLDLLEGINRRSWVGVVMSFSNVDPALKQAFEPRSPGIKRRLEAMRTLATSGILVGASLMPIIPFAGDDEKHLEEAVRATKDHGGSFVLAGGMTLEGVQAKRTLVALKQFEPQLEPRWRELYQWPEGSPPEYSPPDSYSSRVGLLVRELCSRHGLRDRMPRYLGQGPLRINKWIAERLFLRTYDLELERAHSTRIWAYRKAAWLIDEHPESIGELFRTEGVNGLQKLPGIGSSLSALIAKWLTEQAAQSAPEHRQ